MYAHHFGLTQDPFSIAPDPRYLFMSERHREALAHLLYGVSGSNAAAGGSGGGFVLLTGDIGTGKTTICRCFLEQIPSGCHVAYIFNPKLSVTELLQSICEEFHIPLAPDTASAPTVKNYIDALNDFLLHSHANGQSCVLIIDEAQNLAADVLEQLRLLTNLETNERKLLQIVLIGQPELRDMLARPELEQLAQRVIARFHLDALSATEATQYISHRLSIAGHHGALPFEPKALQRIQRLTNGVPRRINLLCGRALLGAWASGLNLVTRAVVDQAACEVFGTDQKQQRKSLVTPVALALGAFVLIAIAGAIWLGSPTPATGPKAVASASSAASAPAKPLTPPSPLEELSDVLPQLPHDIDSAWRELGPVWGLTVSAGDPCQTDSSKLPASLAGLRCYRTTGLTVPLLRQLGSPGILTLQNGQDPPVYAVLVGLTEQTATLRLAGRLHTVRLVGLAQGWRGDFATYWLAPNGYSANLGNGSTGPAVDWLASRLSLLDGTSATHANAIPTLDPALRERVRAFQRTRGITADGQPGPMTFMQIESATGHQTPRLQTEPH